MKNLNVRLAALAAVPVVLMASGCGKSNDNKNTNVSSSDISTRQSILEGSILENTVVADVDGYVTILRREMTTNARGGYNEHQIYRDIVNGDLINTRNDVCHRDVRLCERIVKLGNIEDFLTEEQLLKVSRGNLTDEDLISIIEDVRKKAEEQKAEIKQKSKTK